jgi:hypothetical protein
VFTRRQKSTKWCLSRELEEAMFGTEREEVTVDWRKRRNEEHYYNYNIEEDQTGNACSTHGGEKFVATVARKLPRGRPRSRSKDIRINLIP